MRTRMIIFVSVLVLGTLCGTTYMIASGAQDEPGPLEAVMPPEMAPFEWYVGYWKVKEHHFLPDGRTAEVDGLETITWIVDKHAVQREYESGPVTRAYRALGQLTWNEKQQAFVGTWYDNAGFDSPSRVKGTWDEEARTFTFALETQGPDGSTRKYKVVDKFSGDHLRVATTYLVQGSKETKQLEVHYKRRLPCPGGQNRMQMVDELTGG